jgi:DNA-binding response OmpR family regulator
MARVLVADDSADEADSLAIALRLGGHTVEAAYDGRQALALFESFRPHIAILDVAMPNVDGHEIARQVRARADRPVLIALTGWGQERDRVRALAEGFDHHYTKPLDPLLLPGILDALDIRAD